MRAANFIITLTSFLFLHSCALFKKHPDIVYSGGEGGMRWDCVEFVRSADQLSEYEDGRCTYVANYNPDGSLKTTTRYTKAGRPNERTVFSHDPFDRVSTSETSDSTGLLMDRNIWRLDSSGYVSYHQRVSYTTYKDSAWFEGDNFRYERVQVPKPRPDTSIYHTTWTYAGKKLMRETPGHEKKMLLGQGWNNTFCGIYLFNDTLLIETTRATPDRHDDQRADSLSVKFGNGFTPDTLSFIDRQGLVQQRYTVHHDKNGRPIAVTSENCPYVVDMCPPETDYFFYDDKGNLVEKREAYNCSSPVCPRTARTTVEWKYDEQGRTVKFCCYSSRNYK